MLPTCFPGGPRAEAGGGLPIMAAHVRGIEGLSYPTASVCVNSFDDLALGGPQESPQVGFETLSWMPGLVRLCPLLIVLTLDTSRLCIPSGGSSLPPQIREADYANSNSTFFF